jgi:glycolate oxidase FAD binding subunit
MSVPVTETQLHGIAHLASIVGQEHTQVSGGGILVAPADKQQVADVLGFANARGLTVSATGGGSKLGWGNAVMPAIRLSLERMDLVREHVWADMTCTVEAGCTWAAMQCELMRHGQMVALDPLWPKRATVGGIVATNDSGALRLRYGGLRDLIIGMTVVLADGTIARTGGKVVKNVAGYDLHKLMTGSFGTLGVIADVNFRLHPAETHRLTCTAVAADAAAFAEPLRALLDSEWTLSAVQLRSVKRECALDVAVAARPECLEECAARIRQIVGPAATRQPDESVWAARQQLFENPGDVVLKVSVLPGEICESVSKIRQSALDSETDVVCIGQATGLISVALQSAAGRAPQLIESLRASLRARGGSVVVQRIPDSLRGSVDLWGTQTDALPLMREVKRRFDPKRILNPGRFVGSI